MIRSYLMNYSLNSLSGLVGITWLALVVCVSGAQKNSAEPASKAGAQKAATEASAKAYTEVKIPQSVFVAADNASKGRNPFFPNSASQAAATVVQKTDTTKPEPAVLVLNGITGPPKRTAMINGKTFEAGEESEVRMPSGSKLLIKCVEIGDSSAVFLVAGQRRELQLREGL